MLSVCGSVQQVNILFPDSYTVINLSLNMILNDKCPTILGDMGNMYLIPQKKDQWPNISLLLFFFMQKGSGIRV